MNCGHEGRFPANVDKTTVRYHHLLIRSQPGLEIIINAMPEIAIVLNHSNQIAYANKAFLDLAFENPAGSKQTAAYFDTDSDPLWDHLLGIRIGKALKCVRSDGPDAECGQTPFCRHCGIYQALSGRTDPEETDPLICHMLRTPASGPRAPVMLFRTTVTPFSIRGWDFQLLLLTDIHNEVNNRALGHTLFHHMRDFIDGIQAATGALGNGEESGHQQIERRYRLLSQQAAQASDEITSQQNLVKAERGELNVHCVSTDAQDILNNSIASFRNLYPDCDVRSPAEAAPGKTPLDTDPQLLVWVLTHMILSAANLDDVGDPLVAGLRRKNNGVQFYVRTRSLLPPEKKNQLFQRTFTPKDTPINLNTYSIKLIGEEYLGGTLSCTSSPDKGTVFEIYLPAGSGSAPRQR
jgi:hypothetical protein